MSAPAGGWAADSWWTWANVQAPTAAQVEMLDRLELWLVTDSDQSAAHRAWVLLNAIGHGSAREGMPEADLCRLMAPYLGSDPEATLPTPAEPFRAIVARFAAAVRRRWGLPPRGGEGA